MGGGSSKVVSDEGTFGMGLTGFFTGTGDDETGSTPVLATSTNWVVSYLLGRLDFVLKSINSIPGATVELSGLPA